MRDTQNQIIRQSSLEEQIARLEKLLRNTHNNEDYLDIYSCLVETRKEMEERTAD